MWCGSPNGYLTHFTKGQTACEDCLRARRIYIRNRRFRLGSQHHPFMCRECGSVFVEEHLCSMQVG